MRDKNAILDKLSALDCDAMIVLDDSNRFWLTEFQSSDGIAILSKFETALFLDGRYTEKAFSQKLSANIYPCSKGIFASACEYIHEKGFKAVLVDDNRINLCDYENLKSFFKKQNQSVEIKIGHNFLNEFISTKDESEISLIKEAVKITDNCFSHILNYIKKGVTESELAAEINYFFYKNGCELAFDTIVVSGVKSSMPHGVPENIPITENSFITMDFGAKYKGYCADMTRTVVFGNADDEMKNIYSVVLEANKRGIEAAYCNNVCENVDKAAREYISQNGYGDYFTHSTGHSFGVEIHETPSINRVNPVSLTSGTVITIEPGIYIPKKYGVRIEDTVLILENESIVLSKSPKNLIEIDI